jgi:TPR repeat protein
MSDLEKGLIAFESQNYTQAFNLLKPLAEEGNAEAQCIIANMYHLGLGIEINVPEALQWYLKSSEKGYGIASNNLATLYFLGGNAIFQNKNEADRYFPKAREQGFLESPPSCHYLDQASCT